MYTLNVHTVCVMVVSRSVTPKRPIEVATQAALMEAWWGTAACTITTNDTMKPGPPVSKQLILCGFNCQHPSNECQCAAQAASVLATNDKGEWVAKMAALAIKNGTCPGCVNLYTISEYTNAQTK